MVTIDEVEEAGEPLDEWLYYKLRDTPDGKDAMEYYGPKGFEQALMDGVLDNDPEMEELRCSIESRRAQGLWLAGESGRETQRAERKAAATARREAKKQQWRAAHEAELARRKQEASR